MFRFYFDALTSIKPKREKFVKFTTNKYHAKYELLKYKMMSKILTVIGTIK